MYNDHIHFCQNKDYEDGKGGVANNYTYTIDVNRDCPREVRCVASPLTVSIFFLAFDF